MQPSSRATVLSVVAFVLLALLGVWWYFGFSLDFMQFFASNPIPESTPLQINSPPETEPAQVTCSPSTQTTTIGQIVQLSAQGGVGGSLWFAPEGTLVLPIIGSKQNANTISVSYTSRGIKKVTVQRTRQFNDAVTSGVGVDDMPVQYVDSVACTVIVQ